MPLVIAIVGRPNVGKSTLFNKLTQSSSALVAPTSGLTRDRQYGKVINSSAILIDTGGLHSEKTDLSLAIREQTEFAIKEANVIFFMVDAKNGLIPKDEEVAKQLRKENKPIYLLINKVDGPKELSNSVNFTNLGLKNSTQLSLTQNKGLETIIDIVDSINLTDILEKDEDLTSNIRIALIGRPNVGKSTLINKLVGQKRVIVSEHAGTTRDSIEVPMLKGSKNIILIDTAGIRRKRSVKKGTEESSISQSINSIRRSNVVLLLLDSTESIVDQDLHLLGLSLAMGRSVILGANKIDLLNSKEKENLNLEIKQKIRFAKSLKIHNLSAKNGTGVRALINKAEKAFFSSSQKIQTSLLNKILKEAANQQPPPLKGRFRPKLRYAHAGGKEPPIIIIHGTNLHSLANSYKKYLENFFTVRLKLDSTPLKIKLIEGGNPYEGKKNTLTEKQRRHRKRITKRRAK